jgi:RNA polymerase sigma-70 factor (ECF subfamily)
MTSIARYHALDVLRSQSSRVSRDQNFATEAERARDTLQGLQDQVDDSQLLSICLERLEPEARDCVVHAYCGGYSHQELCDLTGRALGTIKSWIRRSLNSLRECVDELA